MKRILSFAVALALVVSTIIPAYFMTEAKAAPKKEVSILFTHDMHSHLETEKTNRDDKEIESGGFAKIKTIKDQTEEKYKGTFLFDAGDFSMGTPFQGIFKTDAAELKTMAAVGFDATTFGNHEFDYKAVGLADMLNEAANYDGDDKLPAIVGTNINWDKTLSNKDTKKAGKKLKKAFENYGVEDYTIVDKNGVKIAVFGVIGDEAISNAPVAGIKFSDYISRAKKIVKEIKQNDEADMIVCLSHAGTNEEDFSASEDVKLAEEVDGIDLIVSGHSHTVLEEPKTVNGTLSHAGTNEEDFSASEDVKLAEEVDGIDLIVSGHSHTVLEEPKTVNGTIIVSSGEYTNNVGHIVVERDGDGYKVKGYNMIKLDGDVENDRDVDKIVAGFKSTVNSKFLGDYGFSYDEVLAKSDFQFTDITKFGKEQKEDTLANLIADSYIYAVKEAEGQKSNVDVAIVPAGTIRGTFGTGDITAADAFNASSLGMGADGSVGYPIVSIYLTGKELRAAAEVDASISPSMPVARLYTSGLGYTINNKRLFLNRATDVSLINKNGKVKEKLDSDKLYRVVGGLYSCQMLSLVKDQSHGLLSIEPKDKNGNVITDFNKHIVKDKDGGELKEWYAVASYIDSFDDNTVPSYYKTTHNRKIIDNSLNPIKLFKQPNNIAIMLLALIMIPIVIIVGIIIFIVKRRHQRRGYSKSMFSGNRNKMYKRTMGSRGRGPAVKHRKMNVRGNNRRSRF